MKIRFFYLGIVLACMISGGIFMQSCNQEEELTDDAILNSSELEEYIIAGSDFERSLAVFTKELNKMNISTLKVTYDTNGKKVVHLPFSVVSIGMVGKLDAFNEKKDALLKKFPQFVSFREDTGKKYFQQCIQNSVNVKGKLSELGINFSQPRLKSGSEYWYGEDYAPMMSYLYNWANSPDFVELWIILYADGTFATYQNPAATMYSTGATTFSIINGNLYLPEAGYSCNIISIGHTHTLYQNPTPPDADGDNDYFQVPSGVSRFIYYNWGFHYY